MAAFDIVFIHRGSTTFLAFSVAQAISSGYNVIVIGDRECLESLREIGLPCDLIPMGDLLHSSQDFIRIYQHQSINDYDWELFCFKRWFILYDLVKSRGNQVILADSDVFVYPGIDFSLLNSIQGAAGMFNSAWFCHVKYVDTLKLFIQFMLELFSSPGLIAEIGARHSVNNCLHISDMTLLREFAASRAGLCSDTVSLGELYGLDGNIKDSMLFNVEGGFKEIAFHGNLPFAFRRDGGLNRFHTLHFQGTSKLLMQIFNTIDCVDLGKLANLDFYVREAELKGRDRIVTARYWRGKRQGRFDFTDVT